MSGQAVNWIQLTKSSDGSALWLNLDTVKMASAPPGPTTLTFVDGTTQVVKEGIDQITGLSVPGRSRI